MIETFRDTVRGGLRAALLAAAISAVAISCGSSGTVGESSEQIVSAPIVIVLNGCGIPGIARHMAENIRNMGYDVGNGHGENADSFDYPNTLVVDLAGDMETALAIGEKLGAQTIQQISHDPDRFGTVAVIVGADYRRRLVTLHED
jgi:hypothetical protein